MCSFNVKAYEKWNNDIMTKPARPPLDLGEALTRNRITTWRGLRCQSSHIIYQFICYCSYRKGILRTLSAISSILHQSGTQFVNLTTCIHSSCIYANLDSWERGYANCNSTCLVKASTVSGMCQAASKMPFKVGYSK